MEKKAKGLRKQTSLLAGVVAVLPATTQGGGGSSRILENKNTQYWCKINTLGYIYHQSSYRVPYTDSNALCYRSTDSPALESRTCVKAECCRQNCNYTRASTRTPASRLSLLLAVWHLYSVLNFLTGAELHLHHRVGQKGRGRRPVSGPNSGLWDSGCTARCCRSRTRVPPKCGHPIPLEKIQQ